MQIHYWIQLSLLKKFRAAEPYKVLGISSQILGNSNTMTKEMYFKAKLVFKTHLKLGPL